MSASILRNALLQPTSAVSRLTHGGAGNFDIDLPLTGTAGVECRNGGGNYTLVVTFSNTMVSGNASVIGGTGNVAGSPTFSGHTMTINLTGVTDAQTLTVSLTNLTDAFSQVLPSVTLGASFLVGDTNGDGTVNSADIGQTKSQSGNAVTGSNFREDVTVDGNINASDIGLVKSKSGNVLPPFVSKYYAGPIVMNPPFEFGGAIAAPFARTSPECRRIDVVSRLCFQRTDR